MSFDLSSQMLSDSLEAVVNGINDRNLSVSNEDVPHECEATTPIEAVVKGIMRKLDRIEANTLLGVKEALTVNDLHLLTGMKKSTIYKLTSQRKIPHYKSEGGKLTYFKKSEIDDWLCAVRVPTGEQMKSDAVAHALSHPLGKGGIR